MDTIKSDLQGQVKTEVDEARNELKKFQDIFLEQQKLMRDMQDGTIADVKVYRKTIVFHSYFLEKSTNFHEKL